jgi:hypothetical protein
VSALLDPSPESFMNDGELMLKPIRVASGIAPRARVAALLHRGADLAGDRRTSLVTGAGEMRGELHRKRR